MGEDHFGEAEGEVGAGFDGGREVAEGAADEEDNVRAFCELVGEGLAELWGRKLGARFV